MPAEQMENPASTAHVEPIDDDNNKDDNGDWVDEDEDEDEDDGEEDSTAPSGYIKDVIGIAEQNNTLLL